MSDDIINNSNGEQNSAPQVSKISLEELNEIKKTIAPIHSEAEMEVLRNNPDIDPNTVYSEHKVSQVPVDGQSVNKEPIVTSESVKAENLEQANDNRESSSIDSNSETSISNSNQENLEKSYIKSYDSSDRESSADFTSSSNIPQDSSVNSQANSSNIQDDFGAESLGNIEAQNNEQTIDFGLPKANKTNETQEPENQEQSLQTDISSENLNLPNDDIRSNEASFVNNSQAINDKMEKYIRYSKDSNEASTNQSSNDVETTSEISEENQTQAPSLFASMLDDLNSIELIKRTSKDSHEASTDNASNTENQIPSEKEHGLFGMPDEKIVDTAQIPSDNSAAIKAEEEAPKTTKVDMSEIKALQAEMKQEKEGGATPKRSIKDIVNAINHKGEVPNAIDDEGEYDEKLDFERVTDVKKFKLPVRKLPIILTLVFILLAGAGFLLFNHIMENKKNQVYLSNVSLNIGEIFGGYVGDTINLDGVYIVETYSDGSKKTITNIKPYISSVTSTIDLATLKVKKESPSSGIFFKVGEKTLNLTTITLDKKPTAISEIKLVNESYSIGSEIKFDQMLIKVDMGDRGEKLLTVEEIENNLTIIHDGEALSKSETGFLITNFVSVGNNVKFTFRYKENTTIVEEVIYLSIE